MMHDRYFMNIPRADWCCLLGLLECKFSLSKYLTDFLGYQDKKYQFEVYGPMPCVIYELRGKYRMSFVIKACNKSAINGVFKRLIQDFDHVKYPMSFDNDPQDG